MTSLRPGADRCALLVGHASHVAKRHITAGHYLLNVFFMQPDLGFAIVGDTGRGRGEARLGRLLRMASDTVPVDQGLNFGKCDTLPADCTRRISLLGGG